MEASALANLCRMSSAEMDEVRYEISAYEYLCRLEEARIWIQNCIREELPTSTELEEVLRNGIYLAKLAHFMDSSTVPINKIYDIDQEIYKTKGLQFRHTDNINFWLKAMDKLSLPKLIYPDTFDVYDKRNMPKVICCIHALSRYLHEKGLAPEIEDLYGKITFSTEEMAAVQKELDKLDIQMPAFGKIAGTLISDVPSNTATLHAAIIAINDSFEKNEPNLIKLLLNPDAGIKWVNTSLEEAYYEELLLSKNNKMEAALNRSISDSYILDMYAELLTQSEIQDCVNCVNETKNVQLIKEAVFNNNVEVLVKALQNPVLHIPNVIPENGKHYFESLNAARSCNIENNNNLFLSLSPDVIGSVIQRCNANVVEANEQESVMIAVNQALWNADENSLFSALQDRRAKFPSLPHLETAEENVKRFCFQELNNLQTEFSGYLNYKQVFVTMSSVANVLQVNKRLLNNNKEGFFEILQVSVPNVSPNIQENMEYYFQVLKMRTKPNRLVNCQEIINCLERADLNLSGSQQDIIQAIIDSVQEGNEAKMVKALLDPEAGILCVKEMQGCLYFGYLKSVLNFQNTLTRDEIQDCVNRSNQLTLDASNTCSIIGDLNMAADNNNPAAVLNCLQRLGLEVNLITNCFLLYYNNLVKSRNMRKDAIECEEETAASWVSTTVGKDYTYYLNLATFETSWIKPQQFVREGLYLNLYDIQRIVSKVNKKYHKKLLQIQELQIIRLQAVCRGYLSRSSMPNQLRRCIITTLHSAATIIQSYFRMWLARQRYLKRKQFFQLNVCSVRKIQNFWRDYRISKSLTSANPSMEVVSNCVSLLDVSDNDYKEEQYLHNVRSEVVRTIRFNKDLELKVNNMDLKIGLIVRNHLTAQDILCQFKMTTLRRSDSVPLTEVEDTLKMCLSTILLGHNKESRTLLEAYQHLFYLLQTDPKYMARLIYSMSPGRSAMFIDSVIYSLYNYGSTPREECLLLQLFAYALKEEVKTKVEILSDVSTGTPLVFKMVLDYNKTGCGLSCLKELLQPLVELILNDDTLHLSTDPVEIYRRWVNEQESSTGLMVEMPYDLPIDQAEKIPEVIERINISIATLQQKTSIFVNRIFESVHLLPYGIRYVAKVLKTCLFQKFPNATEIEIMKCVGHLLYYRYIIAAIPAADTFGVVALQPGKGIQPIQRRNLGAIAKVLQHAAAFQLFEPCSKLSVLNSFLADCHKTFLHFLRLACSVEEPEVSFNVDTYSEATLLNKPQISLTLQEIFISHDLLNNLKDQVAPDPNDPLHELLEDLGPPLSLDSQYQNELVTLSLTNKFTVEAGTPALDQLLSTTMQMVVQLLQCQSAGATSLLELLRLVPSHNEKVQFQSLVHKTQSESVKEMLSRFGSLVEFKELIQHQLVQLELVGYVSSNDGYQTVINFIARNIVNRKTYRNHRRVEIEKLNDTLVQLKLKSEYYHETLKYYEEYIQNCLQRLSKNSDVKHKVVKYSGVRMAELGVLLAIEGLTNSQLKHVLFEISTTDVVGIFSVRVKFLAAPIEKVEVDIQNLLKLQYEGETIVEMFGHAKININLLLYLLNKKFLNN